MCEHHHTELLNDVTDDDGNIIEEYGCWDCGARFFREVKNYCLHSQLDSRGTCIDCGEIVNQDKFYSVDS